MSQRPLVVVLGPGRSGTSLMMQILHAQGLRVSQAQIPSDNANPEGYFEDSEITAVHQEIFDTLGVPSSYPFVLNTGNLALLKGHQATLRAIVAKNLPDLPAVWGFKAPRAASLLPLWQEVFDALDLVPRYILCMRHPGSVVASMKRQYGLDETFSELVWLKRTVETLLGTQGQLFMVHYEDWFGSQAREMAGRLLAFAHLSGDGLEQTLAARIRTSLNRCEVDKPMANPCLARLYQALKNCPSGDVITPEVMAAATESQHLIRQFSPWIDFYMQEKQAFREKLQQQQQTIDQLQATLRQ